MPALLLSAAMICLLGGCASRTFYAPPSPEELDATKRFKKTVAVLVVNEYGPGSYLWTAGEALESGLSPHYEVVDRARVRTVLSDPAMNGLREEDLAARAGKALRADYAVFAAVRSSSPLPGSVNDLGRLCIQATVTSTVYDVAAEKRALVGTWTEDSCRTIVDNVGALAGGQQPTADQILAAVRGSAERSRTLQTIWEEARDAAIADAAEEMKALNPLEGEVLNVLSDREVLINLGSAYGVEPGRQFVIFGSSSGARLKDPKTGLSVESRDTAATLRVTKVTSGITSVAEGDKKDVARIKPGYKVSG